MSASTKLDLMDASTLGIAAAAYVGTSAVAFALARVIGFQQLTLAFVVGAIVAANVGPYFHYRRPSAQLTGRTKAQLGTVLFVAALLSGAALQLTIGGMLHPDIVIPIAAVGSFAFPFAVSQSMWKALDRNKPRPKPDAPLS